MTKVSIGVPVFNGSPYIRDSLQNLMDQTYKNFEVIISDNHSDDDTPEICREFYQKDRRFKYFRQKENIGMVRNFEYVLHESTSEYFCWRSYDDYSDPNYIEFLAKLLDENPHATLAASDSVWHDVVEDYEKRFKVNSTAGLPTSAAVRRQLIRCSSPWFYGLYRRKELTDHWEYSKNNIGFHGHNSDIMTVAKLVLEGAVVTEPGSAVHLQRFKLRDLGKDYHSIENRIKALKLARKVATPRIKSINGSIIDKFSIYVLYARFLDKKIVRFKPLIRDIIKKRLRYS